MGNTTNGEFKQRFTPDRQQGILALMVRDEDFFKATYELVEPEYFEDEIGQLVAQVHRETYFSAKHWPDKAAVKNRVLVQLQRQKIYRTEPKILERVGNYLDKLYDQPLQKKELVYPEITEFSRSQRFKAAILDSMQEIESGNFESVQDRLTKALSLGDQSGTGTDYLESMRERINSGKGFLLDPLRTGFAELDSRLGGGLDKGSLGVVIAPPKFGKSTALVNFGHGALTIDKSVLHFTVEINEHKIARRYDARISGIPPQDMRKPSAKKDVMRKVARFAKNCGGELHIKGFPTRGVTVGALSNYVYRIQARAGFRPDLIIVDYGDILKPAGEFREERHSQGQIFESLRAMAQEFDVPLWTASQCNRKAASKAVISMEDIAEAYSKVATADVIVALCRTAEERKENQARFFIAGSREGADGASVRLKTNYSTYTLLEISSEQKNAV